MSVWQAWFADREKAAADEFNDKIVLVDEGSCKGVEEEFLYALCDPTVLDANDHAALERLHREGWREITAIASHYVMSRTEYAQRTMDRLASQWISWINDQQKSGKCDFGSNGVEIQSP